MTKIYIIRHAEAEGNLYRRIQGHYDSLVTENGKRQIEALKERFLTIPVDACYASDRYRTQMTVSAVAFPKGLKIQADPRFREVNMGIWEDVPFGEVSYKETEKLELFNKNPQLWHIPGSEAYESYTERFIAAMTEAAEAHPNQTIVIASHGSVVRGALECLFYANRSSDAGHSDNTAVTLLEYEQGIYRLVFANDNSHLTEEISTLAKQKWWRSAAGSNADANVWYETMEGKKEEYLRFRRNAWKQIYPEESVPDLAAFWNYAENSAKQNPNALVEAKLGDRIIGMIELDPTRYAEEKIGYIPFVYVIREKQNERLGIQLIGHAVSFYRNMGREKLRLSVSPENAQGLHFYGKYGFYSVGKTPGKNRELILMEKDIRILYDSPIQDLPQREGRY